MRSNKCDNKLANNFLAVAEFQTAAQVPSLHPLVNAGLKA